MYSTLEVADDLVLSRLISTMLSVTTSDHQSPTYVMTLCEKEVEVERVCDYVLKSGKKGCRYKLLVICDGPMEESSCQCATLWSHQFSVPTKLPH